MLVPTPDALVGRWFDAPGAKPGLSGAERPIATLMELDATVGGFTTVAATDIFPPAVYGPAANTEWFAAHASRIRYDAILDESYDGNPEKAGSDWIRTRWFEPDTHWNPALADLVVHLRVDDSGTGRFFGRGVGQGTVGAAR